MSETLPTRDEMNEDRADISQETVRIANNDDERHFVG